jgi:hypothetical protein
MVVLIMVAVVLIMVACTAQGPEDQGDDGMEASSIPDRRKNLKNL